jgi:uncharacterized protein (TIGR00290 family)
MGALSCGTESEARREFCVREKVVFAWSGGKDSAMALHELLKDERYEVVALLTSVSEPYRRISHHGVREELLEMQAQALGIELDALYLPAPCTNEQYEERMERRLLKYRNAGVQLVAHGDIFLQDLREYRERNLAKLEMRALFPIWRRNTTRLVHQFIKLGFKAHIVCVQTKIGEGFAGRLIDAELLRELPLGVDPCGEYGEFHSFVYDGPIFRYPLDIVVGEIVLRDARYFADLRPANGNLQNSSGSNHFTGEPS